MTMGGSLHLEKGSVPKSAPKYVRNSKMCVVFWARFATRGIEGQKRGCLPAAMRGGVPPVRNRAAKTTHISRFVAFFEKLMARFDYLCIRAPNLCVKDIVCPKSGLFRRPVVRCVPRAFAGIKDRVRGGRTAVSELAKASEFTVLPRRRDERVYAHERGAHPVADP